MNLVAGARTYLAALPELHAVLGSGNGWDLFLFQEQLYPGVLEGTGSTGAVLTQPGSWGTPNLHNTARFPRLMVEVFADGARDGNGNLAISDGPAKIESVFKVFYKLLHQANPVVMAWGDLRIITSHSAGEPLIYPVPDGQGMRRGQFSFNVTLA